MAIKVCSNSQSLSREPNKGCSHTLHLYAPNVDRYTIQKAFLIPAENEEKIVYVTASDRTILAQQFDLLNLQLKIIKPTEIRKLEEENSKLQLIMDAGSIVNQKDTDIIERESYLNELSKRRPINCLCTYDMTKLGFEKIKQLSLYHDQLRLTTSDITILSGDFFDASNVSGQSIEKMVKDNLET